MKNPSESLELKFISEIKKKANTITGGDRERSVEDFFVSFFDGIPGFKASRADAPRLKFHKTLYTDGIVSFNDEIFTVFEFNKVLLFNGSQIIKISIDEDNLKELYLKLHWDDALSSFLNDQRNLSSFLQNIILTKFNTIKPLVEFSFILDTEKNI